MHREGLDYIIYSITIAITFIIIFSIIALTTLFSSNKSDQHIGDLYSYSPSWAGRHTFEKDEWMTDLMHAQIKDSMDYSTSELLLYLTTDNDLQIFSVNLDNIYIDKTFGAYHCVLSDTQRIDEYSGYLFLTSNGKTSKYDLYSMLLVDSSDKRNSFMLASRTLAK